MTTKKTRVTILSAALCLTVICKAQDVLLSSNTSYDVISKNALDLSQNPTSTLVVQSIKTESDLTQLKNINLNLKQVQQEKEPFLKNKRNVYSSLWAFASLNYLYADLVGVMDVNKLRQYQTGVVEGVKITPEFLTIASAFMQIPISNVFLPHVIKNEKTLRWVQIISGTVMTLVQSGTLFVGKPAPYYVLFSACEIAATTYITIDAIRWKAKGKIPVNQFEN